MKLLIRRTLSEISACVLKVQSRLNLDRCRVVS